MTPSTISAPSSDGLMSVPAHTFSGRVKPGRKRSLSRFRAILSARSASCTQRLIESNRGDRMIDNAVPQLPPPMIASFTRCLACPFEFVLRPGPDPPDVGFVPIHNERSRNEGVDDDF